MCVSKIKEIHARVTEFCSGNEMRHRDGRTSEAMALPSPPLRWAGYKKGFKIVITVETAMSSHSL